MSRTLTYLHFAIDDKAIRHLKGIYVSSLPGKHRFIILKKKRESLFSFKYEKDYATHINTSPSDRVVNKKYFKSSKLEEDCSEANIIFFHCLVLENAIRVLKQANRNTLIVWSPWGDDVHKLLPELWENLLSRLSLRIKNSENYNVSFSLKESSFYKFLKKIRQEYLKRKFNWDRIDYFAFFEYYILDLKRELRYFSPERIHLSYYAVENLIFNSMGGLNKVDIQIGHAAWFSDNHLDVLSILRGYNLKSSKVIIPLNYGNHKYANSIERIAKDIFSDKVHILKKWLDLDEYNAVTENVGILIINSKVPVGFGGILAKILQGARIIIPEENIFFKIFKDIGLIFNTIEELVKYKEQILTPLSLEQQSHNIKIVSEIWSLENIRKELNVLYERALFINDYL